MLCPQPLKPKKIKRSIYKNKQVPILAAPVINSFSYLLQLFQNLFNRTLQLGITTIKFIFKTV